MGTRAAWRCGHTLTSAFYWTSGTRTGFPGQPGRHPPSKLSNPVSGQAVRLSGMRASALHVQDLKGLGGGACALRGVRPGCGQQGRGQGRGPGGQMEDRASVRRVGTASLPLTPGPPTPDPAPSPARGRGTHSAPAAACRARGRSVRPFDHRVS